MSDGEAVVRLHRELGDATPRDDRRVGLRGRGARSHRDADRAGAVGRADVLDVDGRGRRLGAAAHAAGERRRGGRDRDGDDRQGDASLTNHG
ncbi:MAG: hypothetical protein EBZ59_02585 [Planctomycetia bacterium]|nr:hypothetical protein [Planctomycetia bacterium]